MDGLSQPLIKGLDDQAPHGRQPKGKEPKAVKSGSRHSSDLFPTSYRKLTHYSLIFCGHEGDTMGQPDWATDGSFLVIRELQQKVPEFDE